MTTQKSIPETRLANQKAQLDKHGNFAEVLVRTTPEAADLINFARLWEYSLIHADRQTRGYVAPNSRDTYKETRQDFAACIALMVTKLQGVAERHELDFTSSNFISRVAQRYGVAGCCDKNKAAQDAANNS